MLSQKVQDDDKYPVLMVTQFKSFASCQ